MKKISGLFIILFFLFSLSSFSQDFEVGPAFMEFSIDPGDSQTKILTVRNHSNFKTPFNILFVDYIINGEGKKEVMERNTSKNSCSEWITPEKTFFDIDPNELIEIKITMQAPEDDYKSRWAMMYIQTAQVQSALTVDKGIGAGVHLSGRIAVQIHRTPVTGIESNMSIKQLREINDIESDERKFKAVVENNGNTIENCKITFVAADLNSGEEFEFDPFSIEFYPGYPREIQFTLPETMPPGEYSFAVLMDAGINSIIKGTRLKETLIILDKPKKSEEK